MTTLDSIKRKINRIYRTDPNIHISVSMNRPKVRVDSQEAAIVGVYPNIFQIEAQGNRYTLQYTDLLTKNVRITELDGIGR